MVRTQVLLDEAQHEAIRGLAHLHRISFSEAVRQLVDKGLAVGVGPGRGKRGAGGLLEIAGIATGGPSDLAEKHDSYLDEDLDR